MVLNVNSKIDENTATEIAADLDIILTIIDDIDEDADEVTLRDKLDKISLEDIEKGSEKLTGRPPIITIMGHVDHGSSMIPFDNQMLSIKKRAIIPSILAHIKSLQISRN